MFKKFDEFLKAKPDVKLIADYPGDNVTKPEGKDAAPYRAGKDEKRMTMKGEKDGEGFADKGDKKLASDVENMCKDKTDPVNGKKIGTWPKTKTEQFVNKTKNLSLHEFQKFMQKRLKVEGNIPPVTALAKGKIYPDPIETTRYVVALAASNSALMENLAHEIEQQEALGTLLSNILGNPKTYKILETVLKKSTAKKLYEVVGKAIGFDDLQSKEVGEIPHEDEDEPTDEDPENDEEMPEDEPTDDDFDGDDFDGDEEPTDDEEMPEDEPTENDADVTAPPKRLGPGFMFGR